jgi:lysyl endopeptidase
MRFIFFLTISFAILPVGFLNSEACNINVLCPIGNGWENERNSVALILNSSSSAFCSGALINNTANLDIPYILTADHCFTGNTGLNDCSGWKFTFQAWSPTVANFKLLVV